MKFLVRKRRTAPAVIIVALIDVLIVLVIFLLVTTTFKQQPAMHLTLPESTQALKSGANENPPLVVSIGADGGLHIGFGANADVIMPGELRGRLQQEAAKNPQLKLAVRADKSAPWGRVVNVIDAAKDAKIKLVSAFTKEPGKP
ncbi:MAG TPA: biopolymer transporter ExbD [Verrucomicrobiae bacterium]